MEIIVGYRVGPQTDSILRYYWDQLSMVARSRRYYGTLFKCHVGVTQRYLLSTIIFV